MRKWIIGILVVLVAAGVIFWATADKDMRGLITNMPTDKNVLFWSIPQRDAAFRAMDRIPFYGQIPDDFCRQKSLSLAEGSAA